MLLIIWLNASIWAVAPLLGWNNFVFEGYQTTCTFDYISTDANSVSFVIAMFVFEFILPIGIIIFSYAYILTSVHKHERSFSRDHDSTRSHPRRCGKLAHANSTEVKISKTALIAIGFFCLSWTPYSIIAIMGISQATSGIVPTVSMLAGIFAKMSTIYNPFIYGTTHPTFRQKLSNLRMAGWFSSKSNSQSQSPVYISSPFLWNNIEMNNVKHPIKVSISDQKHNHCAVQV